MDAVMLTVYSKMALNFHRRGVKMDTTIFVCVYLYVCVYLLGYFTCNSFKNYIKCLVKQHVFLLLAVGHRLLYLFNAFYAVINISS